MKIYYRDDKFRVAAYNKESDRVEEVASADTLDEVCEIAGVPSCDENTCFDHYSVAEGDEADLVSLLE